jgi:hypothetical protein
VDGDEGSNDGRWRYNVMTTAIILTLGFVALIGAFLLRDHEANRYIKPTKHAHRIAVSYAQDGCCAYCEDPLGEPEDTVWASYDRGLMVHKECYEAWRCEEKLKQIRGCV